MFTEDLTTFFADFAAPATIGGVAVRVIFEAAYSNPFGSAVDTTQPTCWAPSASVQNAVQGTSASIGGVSYVVERVEPDGTGISRISLYQQA